MQAWPHVSSFFLCCQQFEGYGAQGGALRALPNPPTSKNSPHSRKIMHFQRGRCSDTAKVVGCGCRQARSDAHEYPRRQTSSWRQKCSGYAAAAVNCANQVGGKLLTAWRRNILQLQRQSRSWPRRPPKMQRYAVYADRQTSQLFEERANDRFFFNVQLCADTPRGLSEKGGGFGSF